MCIRDRCLTDADEYCLLNQRIARLTPTGMDVGYLLWMFKSHRFRRFVDGLNKGSLIQHMYTSQLAKFCLPLPPLNEQLRISQEIERLLSLVNNIENVTEITLKRAERLRQAILREAFAGRLVAQDADDEPASVLLERIKEKRNQNAKKR